MENIFKDSLNKERLMEKEDIFFKMAVIFKEIFMIIKLKVKENILMR